MDGLSDNCLDGNALRKVWFDNLSVTATALDDIRCLGEHVEKKWSYSVFPCVYSRQRVHFSHFCHYYVIEDCSNIIKIRHKTYFEKHVVILTWLYVIKNLCGYSGMPQI